MPVYSVVVPLYNEELVVNECYKRLRSVMDKLNEPYELIFVNDGSADSTGQIVKKLCVEDSSVKMIDFSKNFGHQPAISAGMDYASGDAVIVIDADLQDPPETILPMIDKWKEGYHVVYGKRVKRKGETAFKKLTALLFYRILRSMTSVDIPADTGDFRLIDKKVKAVYSALTEKNRFIRGLISWIGFKQTSVEYIRDERFAGETKYPLKKMIKFAADGIMSFSYVPLKLAVHIGTWISSLSFLYLIVVLVQRIFFKSSLLQGWTTLVALNLIFNGLMMIFLGIIGGYIGRIYDEVKGRPLYIINEKINFEKNKPMEDIE